MKIYYLFENGDIYLLPDPQNNYAWEQLVDAVSVSLGKTVDKATILENAHEMEVQIKAPTIRQYLRTKAELEAENPNARMDEVLARLAEDTEVVQIVSCPQGWHTFVELPLPLQMVIVGTLTRMTIGNPELPFRFGIDNPDGKRQTRQRKRSG